MLVVIEVEKLEVETFNDISKGLEVKVQGKGVHLFPENDYIMRLEEKAKMYDDFVQEQKSGYLGHDVEPRKAIGKRMSFTEKIRNKQDGIESLKKKSIEAQEKWSVLNKHLDEMIKEAKKS